MATNNVYLAQYSQNVAAGMGFTSNFSIQSVGRQIKIRSITLDWHITDAAGVIYDWRTTTDQNLNFVIGNFGLSPQQIGKSFRQTGGTAPSYSGNTFTIHEPGQLIFNCFYVANELPFSLQVNNLNAAALRIHDIAILIETEEQTIF